MTDVMQGVRILEVAEHTFVPAASAVLADHGAEVIKIEHVERGDAMRGLASSGTVNLGGGVHVLLEHSNRGKQSLGLDLTSDEGLDILYKLAATCDVFLTNKMPSVRAKLKVGVDEIRAANPNIIYVRGTGQGERGPDADKGSYDSLAYWNRAGVAMGQKYADDDHVPPPPGPAFGDSIGAMTIAGGIMGALYHREKTGEATTVDVSLLSTGIWSMGAALALSLQHGVAWAPPASKGGSPSGNPLVGNYKTKDDRFVAICCLQPGKYWPEAVRAVGLPELADDPRFADAPTILENGQEGYALLAEKFAEKTLEEWREALADFSGQWAVVQNTLEAAADPQAVANGYVSELETADGVSFQLANSPVQYDGRPAQAKRAPEFNEHGDAILESIGLDMETIIDLKVKGVVA
jgi:crotonobetainyl-CoA:carnitine CoA-transferase CaiB-like acyl-CoA transferase